MHRLKARIALIYTHSYPQAIKDMPPTYLLGLLGHQIQHSLSPTIHSYWFSLYGLRAKYYLYDVTPRQQKSELKRLLDLGVHGLNITAPYKEAVFQEFGHLTDRLKAVNTLVRQPEGDYRAINTDVLAALDVFQQINPAAKIVILGNGGTARALVEAFYRLNVATVHIVQRQQKNWPKVYASLLQFHAWPEANSLIATACYVINTVPNLTHEVDSLNPKTVFCDYIYGQQPSKIAHQAQMRNNVFIPGIEFLLRQAQHSFKEWFSIFPPITPELRAKVST